MATKEANLAATIILVAMGLLFGFSNGFHDAANSVATVIATKSLTPRQAIYSSALFNFLPCLVQSTSVASTIAKIVSTSCLSTHAAGLGTPISNYILPLPMIAGDESICANSHMCLIAPEIISRTSSRGASVFTALIAAIFWNFFTWSVGLPSSSSHALVGGLVGSAVGLFGSSCVNWDTVASVVQAIFASPIVAISVACLSMCAARQSCSCVAV
jgi:PiT family inorganic phosphate transporter